MPSSCSNITMERTKSNLAHIRSNSEASLITEPRLSSFSSEGTADWAVLDDGTGTTARKKVMVVVDHSRESRLAMLWALSHVVQRADTVALIQVLPPQKSSTGGLQFQGNGSAIDVKEPRTKLESRASELGMSLKMLCATRRPEVDIHVLLVEGIDKGPTIVNHAKKFEASVLVLGQRKPSLLQRLFQRGNDALVDYCIENAECLTVAIRKKSKNVGGYLINSRWRKNFWLLA